VIETLTPLVQWRRELWTDSGGAGRFRGGLGQRTEIGCLGEAQWSVSTLIDRTRFPAAGLELGRAGLPGEFVLSTGERPKPKAITQLAPSVRVHLKLPGGGGYGDPFARDPELVLADVVEGYVSLEAARRDYGVAIEFLGESDRLVRTPDLYRIDAVETEQLRREVAAYDAAAEDVS
jgi:N-methylhydantoinase B